MKLTMIFLIAACLHVSATGFGQKVSISGKDLPLEKVFSIIKKQTSYVFFYDYSIFQGAKNVTLDLTNVEIEDAMRACLRGQNLDFSITNKTISITKKAVKAVIASEAPKDPPEVVGTVRSDNGAPLAGATVFIKKLNKSGATNALGEFILKDVPNGKYSVEISYIGYEKYVTEILVENHEVRIVADMKLATNSLDETVIKGYYNTTKRLNTGDVSTLKGEDIVKQPVTDPLAALEGRIPGLYISQTGQSLPGSPFSVMLRGQNSIANGNSPLYILDGVPFESTSLTTISSGPNAQGLSPFNNLNPADIESIEILKDADATSIYGSRGANGVILINTKKGKAGKTKFDVNISSGHSRATRYMDLLNTKQYLMMRREAFKNDGALPSATDYDINGTWDTTRYTNWQKTFLGASAPFTNLVSSISGGNDKTQFVFSGGYSDQGTILPGNFSDKKISGHLNINHTSNDQKFHTQVSVNYVNDNNTITLNDLNNYILLAPDAPSLFDSSGKLNWQNDTWSNPLAPSLQKANSVTDNFVSNFTVSYQLLPGLNIKSNTGYNYSVMTQLNTIPIISYPPEYSSYPILRTTQYGNSNYRTWILEPQLNYIKRIGNLKFDMLFGTTFLQKKSSSFQAFGTGYTSDALLGNLSAASSITNIGNGYSLYHYNAIYGRINLNLKEKYLINFTARRDGSSRFGSSNKFGNFGAIGLGWIFTEEKAFEKGFSFINFGKIRFSYGTTGNDQISDYQYLSTYFPLNYNYQSITGLYPVQLTNPYYGWELDKKLEVGLETHFNKDHINLVVSYYRNRTGNQLVGYSLPAITGFTTVTANLPAIVQNTGFEFSLNTTNLNENNFSWNSSFNLTVPHNKLVSYPNLEGSSYANQYIIGQPLFIKKLFHYVNVDKNSGLYTFSTKNPNGLPSDPQDRTSIKAITQSFYGGLGNDFHYKSFELSVFFQFVKQIGQNYLQNFIMPGAFYNNGLSNQPTLVSDRWKNNGDITNTQKFTQSFGNSYTAYRDSKNSDKGVGDASFIRLKNISFSYQLPASIKRKASMNNFRIFIQCQNLLTITKYQGIDPENQGYIPPVRTITAGLNFTF